MSKPLTEEQKSDLDGAVNGNGSASEAIDAALARLDFLERKVAAADRLAGVMGDVGEADCPYRDNCPVFGSNHGTCDGCRARRALAAYDEVTE
jgi:hypothetical protein